MVENDEPEKEFITPLLGPAFNTSEFNTIAYFHFGPLPKIFVYFLQASWCLNHMNAGSMCEATQLHEYYTYSIYIGPYIYSIMRIIIIVNIVNA